jgi:hypothetical protein
MTGSDCLELLCRCANSNRLNTITVQISLQQVLSGKWFQGALLGAGATPHTCHGFLTVLFHSPPRLGGSFGPWPLGQDRVELRCR